jgi:hypothetical protein
MLTISIDAPVANGGGPDEVVSTHELIYELDPHEDYQPKQILEHLKIFLYDSPFVLVEDKTILGKISHNPI